MCPTLWGTTCLSDLFSIGFILFNTISSRSETEKMCFKWHSAGSFNKYSNCMLSQWHGHLFTVTSSHSLLSSLHRFTVYSRRGSFLRRLFIFYYWRNVCSSQPTPSECQAAPRVWCTAAPRRPCRQPGLNTPQGQTSKTHKACSINYSEWRRLSVADKCVLRFYSCSSLQFQLQGWKKKKKWSTVVH